jgi:hypothetical protein
LLGIKHREYILNFLNIEIGLGHKLCSNSNLEILKVIGQKAKANIVYFKIDVNISGRRITPRRLFHDRKEIHFGAFRDRLYP